MKTMTNDEIQAAMLKRLNLLNRAELAALSDRDRRATPNAVHLASALAKLAGNDAPTRSRHYYR